MPRRPSRPGSNDATSASQAGALASLGIEAVEEATYRALLATHGARSAALATQLDLDPSRVDAALAGLERKGFVSRSPHEIPTYFPVPPDIAVEALIALRQGELHRARAAVTELREVARSRQGHRNRDDHVAEILNRDAASKIFPEVMTAAREEIICFERLPMLVWDATPNDAELQCLARGIRIRIVADSAMLEVPRHLERLRNAVAAGEEYRVFSGLPLKMLIVDRSIGIVPVTTSPVDSSHLLVRSSALLHALCNIFDIFWRLSAPFALGERGPPHDEGDALLALFAAGLNDKTVEQELAISRRTLTRKVTDLMRQHGAATRFQLGWLAAETRSGKRQRPR